MPPLVLDGDSAMLTLQQVQINGRKLSSGEYQVDSGSLTMVPSSAEPFELQTECVVAPAKNTRLEGLYVSGKNFCTHCEAMHECEWYFVTSHSVMP